MRIHELLRTKGFHVITVRPSATVLDVVGLLEEYNLGAVVVSEDGREVTGIVSERDIVRHLLGGTEFLTGPVSAIMTSDVHTCAAQDSVQALMGIMTEQRIRHLPVVDDSGRLAGIVSIGDAVKSHITQIEFERDQLQGYVSG